MQRLKTFSSTYHGTIESEFYYWQKDNPCRVQQIQMAVAPAPGANYLYCLYVLYEDGQETREV